MCEAAKVWVEVLASLLGLIGTVTAALGTYLITQWYHPFSLRDFAASSFSVFWYFVTFRYKDAIRAAARYEEISPNREHKEVSLSGIYLVAVGFIFQMMSSLFLFVDAILNFVHKV